MKIVQISDIHVESGGFFRPDLMERVVEETNSYQPDLVAVAGDLTGSGYQPQFEQAKGYLDRLQCQNVVAVMGNHDAKNVGDRYFQELFGLRNGSYTLPTPEGEAKVVALDTSKPDLNDGEVGREYYGWLDSELIDWDRVPRLVILHHYVVAVPGTGRDQNILRDAGEVVAVLREVGVDLILAGHRRVPYYWNLSGVRIVHSGTAASERIRGTVGPSYNLIELGPEEVEVTMRDFRADDRKVMVRFSREPDRAAEFYLDESGSLATTSCPSRRLCDVLAGTGATGRGAVEPLEAWGPGFSPPGCGGGSAGGGADSEGQAPQQPTGRDAGAFPGGGV